MRWPATLLIWIWVATSAGAQLSQQLQDVLHQYQKTLNIIGVSASVAAPQIGVWNGTAGWIDTLNGTPLDTNTLFGIGSITKTVTAVVALQLWEEKVWNLDDPIARLLPSFHHPFIDSSITLRQLLNHTSGLGDYARALDSVATIDPGAYWHPDSLFSLIPPPISAPNDTFYYSNTNYLVVGKMIIEHTNQPLSRCYRQRIFSRLGPGIYLFPEEALPADYPLAHPHYDLDGDRRTMEDASAIPLIARFSGAWAAGGIMATAKQVRSFIDSLFRTQTLLSPAALQEMLTPSALSRYTYALGIARRTVFNTPVWVHGGSIKGYAAFYLYAPEHQISIAVLVNQQKAPVRLIALALLQTLLNSPTTVAPTERSAQPIEIRAAHNGICIANHTNDTVELRVYSLHGALLGIYDCTPGTKTIPTLQFPRGTYILVFRQHHIPILIEQLFLP